MPEVECVLFLFTTLFSIILSLFYGYLYISMQSLISQLCLLIVIKNEVGCRDDTVPKTVDTRRHCEED